MAKTAAEAHQAATEGLKKARPNKRVPRDPTPEMLAAGQKAPMPITINDPPWHQSVWQAMYDAAPEE